MTKEEHKNLMFTLLSMSKEEIDEMYNSGIFNAITEGYLMEVLKTMGLEDRQDEAQAILYRLHDELTAGEARKRGKL